MALLTRREFGDKCNLPTNTLAIYVTRKKVVVGANDLIDTTDPINEKFINKRGLLLQKKGKLKINQDQSEQITAPNSTNSVQKDSKKPQNQGNSGLTWFQEAEKEKALLEIEKKKREIKKLDLGNEKTIGNFIKVEQVKLLILQLSDANNLAWENEYENFIIQCANVLALSREQVMELKKLKIQVSNNARERAITIATTNLRRLQKESIEKRGVGEHG